MPTINYKFSNIDNSEFVKLLCSRVNDYFKKNKISRKANTVMISKTILVFGFYLGIYLILLLGGIQHLAILFLLWGLLGFGQALVGFCVMHDKVHNAYVKNKIIRSLLEIPIIAIGVESDIWKIEHNYMHHNYTNIEGIDQDIHPRFLFRFSVNQPKKWFHRYQHLYALFFYAFLIIEWITIKDFAKVVKYRRLGYIKSNLEAGVLAFTILIKKSIFYLFFLIIPWLLLPYSFLMILAMFMTMLGVAGIVMTIIFQTAHVVPNTTFFADELQSSQENWYVHQLNTTSNFAGDNKIISYFLGGLNFQIEHHLFPTICHVHYPEISKIVRATTQEFGMPYHYYNTLSEAVNNHFSMLKTLGK